jgi:integrase
LLDLSHKVQSLQRNVSPMSKKLTIASIKSLQYTKTQIDQETGKKKFPKQIIWDGGDGGIKGLGVRVFPSGQKTFVYQYRTEQGEKRLMTLGDVGELTIETAREAAGSHAVNIRKGADPLETRHQNRHGRLMSDLCEDYIERHAKDKKKSWKLDEGRNRLYIVPLLGRKQVQSIKRQDIANLMHEIGQKMPRKSQKGEIIGYGMPTMANRVLEQLSKMFELAVDWGYVPEDFRNPAKGIEGYPQNERTAYVKLEDWPILAKAIENEENPIARLVIWMYILTGKRRNEILQAKWSDLDEEMRILKLAPLGRHANRKSGSTKGGDVEFLPLSDEVIGIIKRAKKYRVVGNDYIFPGKVAGQHFVNIGKPWARIKKEAFDNGATSVKDVVIHSLRHTVAVWLVNHSDADTELVGKVLNQKSMLATKKYAKYKTSTVAHALQQHGAFVKTHAKPKAASVADLKKKGKTAK